MATVIALSIVGPGALAAAGDDGPPRTARPDRPTRTILRPTEIPDLDPLVATSSGRPVCILVGGIASEAPDGTFDALVAALESQCEVHRFGGLPEHPYDTTGSLDANADELIREVRDLARTHPDIKIVTHSMGGAVADDAFRRGLSAKDHVSTYVALAAPHNGSTEARMGQGLLAVAGIFGIAPELRAVTGATIHDIGSPAVGDLATLQAGPPPPGIRRIDLRMANDGIVTGPDALAPGVESRVLLPSTPGLDGHGAITADPRAVALVAAAVAGPLPQPDLRGRVLDAAAAQVSSLYAIGMPFIYLAVGLGLLSVAGCVAVYRRRKSLTFGLVS